MHFHINKTVVIRRVKRKQLSFLSIEINKPLLTLVCSVSLIRFKFRSHLKLLSQIRCLITVRIESSIISIDSSITDNVIRTVINIQQEKCTTTNGALRNSRINWKFLWRLSIQNHSKQSVTEKRRNRVKYLTWNSIRLKFVKWNSMQNPVKALNISSATARVAPDLLKALAILSDMAVRTSPVD